MTNSLSYDVAIVGAGQAGIQVAQSLRKRGYQGRVALFGDEGYPAYQRPPLSKAFLKGDLAEARLFFKPEAYYAEHGIDLYKQSAVAEIDTEAATLQCRDGSLYLFGHLVLATGSTPVKIPLPGADLAGVSVLRGLSDAITLRERLKQSQRLIVIGGGYIGLEAASAARQLGVEVTVVERMPRLLSRVTAPPISEFYLHLHQDQGVDVRLGNSVAKILGEADAGAVELASGETLEAQAVLFGVGVRPNQRLAADAGIDCDDGVLVDSHCQTSKPRVYAAGDCARRLLPDHQTLRLESVHNALDQAERIAAHVTGDTPPRFDPPWFWSDQYHVKLQTVGLFNDYTDIGIRGDTAAEKFSALYFKDDTLIALDAVNDPISFMAGKQILKQRMAVSKSEAMSAATLKDLLAGIKPKEATS